MERRWISRNCLPALLILLTILLASQTRAEHVEEIIQRSREARLPILAIGSSESCGPCRALHATLHSDPQLQPLLEQCILLEMDVQADDFANFASRFSADTSRIPMVYVVLPTGDPLYAQSGELSGDQIAELLNRAISRSAVAQEIVTDFDALLDSARVHARKGNLIQSLQTVEPIANLPGQSAAIRRAIKYRTKLIAAIDQWLQGLNRQMATSDGIHGAAYRIAELYVELPSHPSIHRVSGDLLRRYQADAATRTAVQQAKRLLKARFHEDHQAFQDAIASYQQVVALDDSSPAASFARQRIAALEPTRDTQMASGS